MKLILFSCLFLSAGIVYVNYYMAQKEEENSTRFIISQESALKDTTQKSLTANILAENDTEKQSTAKKRVHSIVQDLQNNQQTLPTTPTPQNLQTPITPAVPTSTAFTLLKSVPNASINSLQSGKTFMFELSKEVDIESFFTHFSLTPSTDGKFSGEMNYGETKNIIIVNPIPHLTAGTKYTITLKQGLQSFDGSAKLEKDEVLSVDIK